MKLVKSDKQVSCEMEGDAVILHIEDGVYYELDEVGNFIWQQLDSPVTINEIVDKILTEYDVDREQCEKDTQEIIQQLSENGLVEEKS